MYVFHYESEYHLTLEEMTAKEYHAAKKKQAADVDGEPVFPYFVKVSAEEARNYVKTGGHHMTPLYVDNGKVRYAKDSN